MCRFTAGGQVTIPTFKQHEVSKFRLSFDWMSVCGKYSRWRCDAYCTLFNTCYVSINTYSGVVVTVTVLIAEKPNTTLRLHKGDIAN